jgi:hypothetical protein
VRCWLWALTLLTPGAFHASHAAVPAPESLVPRIRAPEADTALTGIAAELARLRQRRAAENAFGFSALTGTWNRPSPMRQALQMPGLLGGTVALKFDRGGFKLPDLNALRSGATESFGQAVGSHRSEMAAEGLALGGGGKLGAQWLRFSGKSGGGERLALSLNTGRLKVDGLRQALDKGVSIGQDLAAPDRKYFGNESGMQRSALNLGYRLGAKNALAFAETRLAVNGTEAEQRRIAFDGKDRWSLALESGKVDRGFDRAGSLGEAEKKLFGRERGFEWREVTARLKATDWASIENLSYRSRSEDGSRERDRLRTMLTLTPITRTRLSLTRDQAGELSGNGAGRETTTQSVEWEHKLRAGLGLRALHETVETEEGEADRSRTRRLLSLTSPAKRRLQWSVEHEGVEDSSGDAESLRLTTSLPIVAGWRFGGRFSRTSAERAPDQTDYVLSLTGKVGRRWQIGADGLRRGLGGGHEALRHSLALTGAEGALGGIASNTRISVSLTSADRVPLTLAPMSRPVRPGPAGSDATRWSSGSFVTETRLRRSQLMLGAESYRLPRDGAGGAVYWWRSAGKEPLQWELRRNWLTLENGQLVPRERAAISYRWRRCRMSASRELNPEPSPNKPLLGHHQSAVEFQSELGDARVTATFGRTEDQVAATDTRLHRLSLESELSHRGSFQVTLEANETPAPTTSIPDRRLYLAYRQQLAPDRRIDLQADYRTWQGDQIRDDLTWRLDLLVAF